MLQAAMLGSWQTNFLKPVLGCPRTVGPRLRIFHLPNRLAFPPCLAFSRLTYVRSVTFISGQKRSQTRGTNGWGAGRRVPCQELIKGRRRRSLSAERKMSWFYIRSANGSSRLEDSYRRYRFIEAIVVSLINADGNEFRRFGLPLLCRSPRRGHDAGTRERIEWKRKCNETGTLVQAR